MRLWISVAQHPSKRYHSHPISLNMMHLLGLLLILTVVAWDCTAEAKPSDHQALLLTSMIPTAFSARVSQKCRNDSLVYLESILRSRDWAWTMLDASGKLSDIYFNANQQSMGHFDQCLAVVTPEKFHGKYCTVYLQSESSSSAIELLKTSAVFAGTEGAAVLQRNGTRNYNQPSVGLCLPSSCSAHDIKAAITEILSSQLGNYSSTVNVTTQEELCYVRTKVESFDAATITVGTVFSILVVVILVGTCLEGWSIYFSSQLALDSLWFQPVLCFSLISNGRKLFSAGVSNDSGAFTCLYGIRFLTMTWVVVGHVWIQGVLQYNQNLEGLLEDGRRWQGQAIANGTVSVDSFFLLSGLLVSYNLLQLLQQNKGKFNLAVFYLHRYIRITPVYVAVFAFVSTILVHVGSGPHWFNVKFTAANCRRIWWQQFLFINNFVPKGADEQCMTETWYLSNDFQMFLVSPLLIYPLYRWRNKGLVVLFGVTSLSLAGSVFMFYTKGMPPTSMITRPLSMSKSLVDFWVYYYPQPWFRSPPYLVGIFLGYILHITRDQSIYISKFLVCLGWIVSCLTCVLVIFGLSPYLNEDLVPHIHPAVSVLYGAFHRFAWGLALAWIIFACVRGYGGAFNDFLSWQFFVPLGRLSYCTYLLHYNVILVYYAHKRTPSYYTSVEQLYSVCGNLAASVFLALLVCLAVEMPFISLERLAFSRTRGHVCVPTKTRCCKNESCGKINQAFSIA